MKKNHLKILAIVIFCGFFDMLFHALISPLPSDGLTLKPSVFVTHGLMVHFVIIWELLAFGVLAAVFLLIEPRLPGSGKRKGLLFGLSFGGLYQVGMLESTLLLKSSIKSELLMGLADSIPIFLLGLFMGISFGTAVPRSEQKHRVLPIFVIAAFYLTGRYLAYSVLHIQSAYIEEPMATFLWTLCMGLWIGLIYVFLQAGIMGKNVFTQSLFFGAVIFGANWLTNHLFIAVVSEWSPDLLIRAGTDIVFISIGSFVCRILFKGNLSAHKYTEGS